MELNFTTDDVREIKKVARRLRRVYDQGGYRDGGEWVEIEGTPDDEIVVLSMGYVSVGFERRRVRDGWGHAQDKDYAVVNAYMTTRRIPLDEPYRQPKVKNPAKRRR